MCNKADKYVHGTWREQRDSMWLVYWLKKKFFFLDCVPTEEDLEKVFEKEKVNEKEKVKEKEKDLEIETQEDDGTTATPEVQ